MAVDKDKHRVLPRRIRWLALAAGCSSGVAGCLIMGYYFAIYPVPLILGAAAQPRYPLCGRWIIRIGALILSIPVLPYGGGLMLLSVKHLYGAHDFNFLSVLTLWAVSFSLLTWCDVALVIDAFKGGRARQTKH